LNYFQYKKVVEFLLESDAIFIGAKQLFGFGDVLWVFIYDVLFIEFIGLLEGEFLLKRFIPLASVQK
jgi:hypothetical protein